MYEDESKELSQTMKSLDFLSKLPPSNRRDSLVIKIKEWLDVCVSTTKHPSLDIETTNSLNWLSYLENQCDNRGILREIQSKYKLTSRGTGL